MASVDKGQSVHANVAQSKTTFAFPTGQAAVSHGVHDPNAPGATRREAPGGLNGAPSLDHTHPGRTSTPTAHGLGNAGGSIPGVIKYFKMRGYYVAGAVFET